MRNSFCFYVWMPHTDRMVSVRRVAYNRLGYANLDLVCPGEVFDLDRHCLLLSVAAVSIFDTDAVFILRRREV